MRGRYGVESEVRGSELGEAFERGRVGLDESRWAIIARRGDRTTKVEIKLGEDDESAGRIISEVGVVAAVG